MTEAQWLTVYRETIRPLYSYVSCRTGGERDLAEDIVQETYLRALNTWLRKQMPENPMAWLKRVARNLLISHLRRIRWHNVENLDLNAAEEKLPLEDLEKTQIIYRVLSGLKKGQARILEAFYFDGLKVKEIASSHGISERAAEGRLRRARQVLKNRLARQINFGGKNDQAT